MNFEEAHRILGTTEAASQDDIRKAFRKKAAEAHPDRNPGDSTAEDKFKQINEAYQILTGAQQPSPQYNDVSSVYENMRVNFEDFFGAGGFVAPQIKKQPKYQKKHIQKSVQLSFEESILGAEREFEYVRRVFCKKCKAEGLSTETLKKCSHCRGTGMVEMHRESGSNYSAFTISTCPNCKGEGKIGEPCPECGGSCFTKEKKTAKIKIPPVGSHSDIILRYPREGNVYPDICSDLLISILPTVTKDNMIIDGINVIMNLSVPLHILLFGGERQIKVVGQAELKTIRINESSKVGDTIVLDEYGVKGIKPSSAPGKLVVKLDIDYPKKLTPELKEQLTKAYED